MEIRFTENFNDYLVYGINENDIEKCFYYLDKGIDVFYKEFKNEKNLIIQAHPCRNSCVTANPKSLDGAEVFNFHAGHNAGMTKAARFAKCQLGTVLSIGDGLFLSSFDDWLNYIFLQSACRGRHALRIYLFY